MLPKTVNGNSELSKAKGSKRPKSNLKPYFQKPKLRTKPLTLGKPGFIWSPGAPSQIPHPGFGGPIGKNQRPFVNPPGKPKPKYGFRDGSIEFR